jgi:hypothetical protein
MSKRYTIKIEGQTATYLKRVKHGEPYVCFDPQYRAAYDERTAKGWVNTCRKFWQNVEMVAK